MKTKLYKKILSNNTLVYIYHDSTKHSYYASYVVRYGGKDNQFYCDGKLVTVKNGIAHFLEHTLLEKGMYGNMSNYLKEKQFLVNGGTSPNYTQYYFRCTKNLKEGLEVLIKSIDHPAFTEEDLNDVKPAIIEEIRMQHDSLWKNYFKTVRENLFHNCNYVDNLGSTKEIQSLTKQEVMECYNAFYQPSNKILLIGGNIDVDDTIDFLETIIEQEAPDQPEIEPYHGTDPDQVRCKKKTIKHPVATQIVGIQFKVNIADCKIDRRTLYQYIVYFLSLKFSKLAPLQQTLIKENIILDEMDYGSFFYEKFLIIDISAETKKEEEFCTRIKDEIIKKDLNEEYFELLIRSSKTTEIFRHDNLRSNLDELLSSIMEFDYDDFDTNEFFDSFTIKELYNLIDQLDFTNTTQIKIINK